MEVASVSDLLDQNEIDALLSAVDSGDVESNDEPEPVAATEVKRAAPIVPRADVQTYDFKRPERVSKDQMRSLETLHESFARNLGASLAASLRTICEVSVGQIEQLTYSEFVQSLPNPTCFNLLKSEELGGQLCLEMSPLIIFPIIDRMLGGSNAELFIPQRPLTAIEESLVARITDRATHHLSDAWSQVMPVKIELEAFESNPQLAQIVPPNETVVTIGLEVKLGAQAGTMSLCFPYQTIEQVMSKLSNQNWVGYESRRDADVSGPKVRDKVDQASVTLEAILATTSIKLSELMNLQPGDIITTDKRAAGDIELLVEGKPKFSGKLGQYRGNRCVRVTQITKARTVPAAAMPQTV